MSTVSTKINTTTINDEVKKNEKTPARIKIEKTMFPKLIETLYADTDTISQLINSTFIKSCPQYYGSKIEVDQFTKGLKVTVFFTHNTKKNEFPEGTFEVITPFNDNKKTNVIERMKAYNFQHQIGTRPKMFKLTDDGKDVLSEFVPRDNRGNINWNGITHETSITNAYGSPQFIIGVQIDLLKFIRRVYGPEFSYNIFAGNPINNAQTMNGVSLSNNWQVFIMRASKEDIAKIAKMYGFGSANNMGIVTVE